jgi:hypothetical protein
LVNNRNVAFLGPYLFLRRLIIYRQIFFQVLLLFTLFNKWWSSLNKWPLVKKIGQNTQLEKKIIKRNFTKWLWPKFKMPSIHSYTIHMQQIKCNKTNHRIEGDPNKFGTFFFFNLGQELMIIRTDPFIKFKARNIWPLDVSSCFSNQHP